MYICKYMGKWEGLRQIPNSGYLRYRGELGRAQEALCGVGSVFHNGNMNMFHLLKHPLGEKKQNLFFF